jgi:hypothetical protein
MYLYGFHVNKNSFNMDDVLRVVNEYKPEDNNCDEKQKKKKKRRKKHE